MTTFTVATNKYRSAGNERIEYHACVAWDDGNGAYRVLGLSWRIVIKLFSFVVA